MKTNILFFTLLLILLAGCSKDDSSADETEILPDEKFLTDVKGYDNTKTIFSVAYNTEKNVENITFGDDGFFNYTYDGNRISNLDVFLGATISYTFSYDGEDHIIAFTKDGINTPVTYNAVENYYFYVKENGDEETIFLDADGDAKKLVSFYLNENKTETINILYESGNHKGTFTNTNNPTLAMNIAIPEYHALFLLYNLSKKPIKTLVSDEVLEYENTFDGQGFLVDTTYDHGDGPITINFNYLKL